MNASREVSALRASYDKKVNRYQELENLMERLGDYIKDTEGAIDCLTSVLSITQEGIIHYIEGIMELALQYVHGEQYSARLIYEMKRNQPEVRIRILKDGLEMSPKFSCGVGVIDVASFALRLALWSIIEPRTAPVIVTDEPFRHVHGDSANEKIGIVVKKLSAELGLQIIMVTGENAMGQYADKSFRVTQQGGISNIMVDTL